MLDGAADAASNIEVRCHNLARLSDLQGVRGIAGVYRCTAGSDCRAQFVGQGREQGIERFGAAQTTATRNDHAGCGEFRSVGL